MKRKNPFLVATSILLLLLVPSIGLADIDEDVMTAGDTFIYDVNKFEVPVEDILGELIELPMGYSLGDLVVDLTGSTLAMKVMALDDNGGFYVLNSYVILGEDIEIPFPENAPPEITEVFGNKLIIPEGVGLSLPNATIFGSDYLDFYEEDFEVNYEPGLPFYLDPDEWDEYEKMFEDLNDVLAKMNLNVDLDVNIEDGEFIVEVTGHVGSGAYLAAAETTTTPTDSSTAPTDTSTTHTETSTTTEVTAPPAIGFEPDLDLDLEIAWHEKGDYAGILKRVSGQVKGSLVKNGKELTMDVDITFKEKRANPLPEEIDEDEKITLEMDDMSFSYDVSGFMNNSDVTDPLDYYEDEADDMIGEEIFEFEITDVDGCYYETAVDVYDGNDVEGMWWNGFTGNPVSKYRGSGPWKDWLFYVPEDGGPGGIIPFAPGITPDWDMWQSSILSISEILDIIESSVTVSSAEEELAAIGMTINEFDFVYEMRANKDYKVFYLSGVANVEWNTTDWEDFPFPISQRPYADVMVDINAWLMYTDEGLIVGLGLDIEADLVLVEFPYYTDDYGYTYFGDGSLSLDLAAYLRNQDFEELPDPSSLPEDTEGEGEEDGGAGITPGFSIVPALLIFAAIAVIIKRREK